jgi:hypothetical protein
MHANGGINHSRQDHMLGILRIKHHSSICVLPGHDIRMRLAMFHEGSLTFACLDYNIRCFHQVSPSFGIKLRYMRDRVHTGMVVRN